MRLAAALALLTLALPAAAQGRWTDTFAVPGVYDGSFSGSPVNAVTADGAGALVGGTFRVVDDVEVNNVARWTGTAWEALGGGVRCADCGGSPFPARVQAVVRDAAGAVWVTGTFDTAVQPDGTSLAVDGLARWSGSAWDAPGRLTPAVGDAPTGYALLVQGASVVVAGIFGGVLRPDGTALASPHVVRWTGGAWEPMRQDIAVYALAAGADARALSAGLTALPDGTEGLVVTAWDGAEWQPVTGVLAGQFAAVRTILVDGGGLIVGGAYIEGGRAADGSVIASRGVVRWTGAAWEPLGRGIAGVEVRTLARDASGLLVGGLIDGGIDAGGSVVGSRALVRWTGSAWHAVPGGERRASVEALSRLGAETLFGGQFLVLSGSGDTTRRASNLAMLAPGGAQRPLSAWTGRDGTTYADGSGRLIRLAPDGCGGVHVVAPEEAGPRPETGRGVFRTWTGAAWQPVPAGLGATALRPTTPTAPTYVAAVASVPGACDAFVVAGSFAGIDGPAAASANVARWSGTAWQPLGRGVTGTARAVAVGPDGAVTVGGLLSAATQTDGRVVQTSGIARWTPNSGWAPLGGGLRSERPPYLSGAFALLAEPDGAVVVGGGFEGVAEPDGTVRPANSVARWAGTAWETFGGPLPSFGLPTTVQALVRWNGLLVIGGPFAQVAQPSGEALDARAVAAWDGTAWRALPGLDTAVEGLAVVDGELFASGGLGQRAARWTGTTWVPLGDAPPGALEIVGAGRSLYLGGTFETAGGIGSPGLARFYLDGIVATDAPAAAGTSAFAVFPNPARTSATIRFRTDAPGYVWITLLDALGRTVAVLADGEMAVGDQTIRADVSRLPAGVYVARVVAGGRVQTQRVTVVR